MRLCLILDQKIRVPVPPLLEKLGANEFQHLYEVLLAELSVDNPAALKHSLFQKGRFSKQRQPRELVFCHLRKPKTNPYLEIPIGWLKEVVELLRGYGFEVEVENLLCKAEANFLSSIQLMDYQDLALNNLLMRHRGILVAPCGAGKTVMSLELIKRRNRRALVLVHTLDLLEQWVLSAKTFLGVEAATIGGGKKNTDSSLIVGTVQSLVRDRILLSRLSETCGIVVVDECHHTPASTFTKVVGLLKPEYLYGVSATPTREDGLSSIMHFFLGPILHQIKTESLQKTRQLLRPGFKPIETSFFFAYDKEDNESWHQMMEALIRDPIRNELIVRHLLLGIGKKNLILSSRIEHLNLLVELLKNNAPKTRIALVTGQTAKKERLDLLNQTRDGQIDFLFSTQLADEGLDIRCLENLFLVTPTRNSSRIQQRVGRIMRLFEGKNPPVVYDFVDTRTKVLLSQYRSRFHSVYQKILDLKQQ